MHIYIYIKDSQLHMRGGSKAKWQTMYHLVVVGGSLAVGSPPCGRHPSCRTALRWFLAMERYYYYYCLYYCYYY